MDGPCVFRNSWWCCSLLLMAGQHGAPGQRGIHRENQVVSWGGGEFLTELFVVAMDEHGEVGEDVDGGVRVVLQARAFDDGAEDEVGDVVVMDEAVLVGMALEDGDDMARIVDDFSYLFGVVDGQRASHRIETLMGEDDGRVRGCFEVGFEPVEFVLGDVGIAPCKVSAAIGRAIAGKAGIEDDNMDVPRGVGQWVIEAVIGWLGDGVGCELVFGEGVDTVVAKDIVARRVEPGHGCFDGVEVGEFFFDAALLDGGFA